MSGPRHFGRRGGAAPESKASPRPFGRRGAPDGGSAGEPSVVAFSEVAKLRLEAIHRDLVDLYQDPGRREQSPVAELSEAPDPQLSIGEHAVLRVDDARGCYVLTIDDGRSRSVTIETRSDDAVLDHIVGHLALGCDPAFSATGHGVVASLVGHTLDEVEHSLILATLRQCGFDRARAAKMLGIPLRSIRQKVRNHRKARDAAPEPEGGALFYLRRAWETP